MKIYFVVIFIAIALMAFSQTIIFEDDFENGLDLWTLETYPLGYNTWGLVDYTSHSPTHCLTESPVGNYEPFVTYTATIAEPLDLSSVIEAELSFWMKYDVEFQFYDYINIDISPNNGVSWTNMGSYSGTGNNWEEYLFSLAAFVGNTQVLIRWELFSDINQVYNGLCLDDVIITDLNEDTTPPIINYEGPEFYEGTDENFCFEAEIIEVSGLASVSVIYTIEEGNEITVFPTGYIGDIYSFSIPFSDYGDQIDYKIVAVDASPNSNFSESTINSFIFGHHLIYDSAQFDYCTDIQAGNGVAVKMTNPDGIGIDLHYALIRNYIYTGASNSDMEFHVWNDNGGVPGDDLITPFMVTPEATLEDRSPMTRVDLRPYYEQLSDIQGDFYIGFIVLTDMVLITETQPGTYSRSFNWNGSYWTLNEWNDFHFRSVVGLIDADFTGSPLNGDSPLEVSFTDMSAGAPTTWLWDFDNDGFIDSNEQNPSYTYLNAGTYTVSLTVSDGTNEDTEIKVDYITVNSVSGDIELLPINTQLYSNYPDPFNPLTSIQFDIKENEAGILTLFNIKGQIIESLQFESGKHNYIWDATNRASGIYFYKLQTQTIAETRKMLLLK